jgi:adenosylcobinamide kinase/adenosylcobinamide-phosphate guanylyltransferase
MNDLRVARSELILGGQKSGKTSRAELLAAVWLGQSQAHRAVYIATAQAWDEEMRARIERHRADRTRRVPRMSTVEEPLELAHAIGSNSRADTLIVVDCLTLWLTARLMPSVSHDAGPAPAGTSSGVIGDALRACAGPIVLISNEIGLGVVPAMGRDVLSFVDALGSLNQEAAAACERVTLMSAGLPLMLKGQA